VAAAAGGDDGGGVEALNDGELDGAMVDAEQRAAAGGAEDGRQAGHDAMDEDQQGFEHNGMNEALARNEQSPAVLADIDGHMAGEEREVEEADIDGHMAEEERGVEEAQEELRPEHDETNYGANAEHALAAGGEEEEGEDAYHIVGEGDRQQGADQFEAEEVGRAREGRLARGLRAGDGTDLADARGFLGADGGAELEDLGGPEGRLDLDGFAPGEDEGVHDAGEEEEEDAGQDDEVD